MSSNDSTTLSLADVSSDTVAALWCRIYGYLPDRVGPSLIVCKTFLEILPVLLKKVNYSTPAFSQQSFETFTGRYRCLETLNIDLEYDEGLDMLDWTKVSLPKLQHLGPSCCPIKSIHFTQVSTPSLQSLSISNQGPREAEEIVLDLPHLTSLDFEHTHVRVCCFTFSLPQAATVQFIQSGCSAPALEQAYSAWVQLAHAHAAPQRCLVVQLWGIGDHHRRLHLPECCSLNLYRSDDLEWLEMHAPKLRSLNLQACYSCEHVRLFPKDGPEVSVNYVNANIGTKSLKHLAQHPRVGMENMHGSNDDDDDIGGVLGDYPPPNMAGMNMGSIMGGTVAQLLGNMMGNPRVAPAMGGGYHGDSDEEEDDDIDDGAASNADDAYLMSMIAMMQQAGYGVAPGHGPHGAADEEDEDKDEEDEDEDEEEEEEEEEVEDSEGNVKDSEAHEEGMAMHRKL